MNSYERALELQSELIENRRWFHQTAEVGLDMPKAKAYVMEKLAEYGLEPKECGAGVTATLGKGGKTLLLRADMDALPMAEESGLPFACPTGQSAHTCGHDFHAAMLLTAAKLLKEREQELKGTILFMFQPAEEPLIGCRDMLDHGLLDGCKPDAALAVHVSTGALQPGAYLYNNAGDAMMFSVDGFTIHIHGRGSHGAYPHQSIDPINIGVHIHLALQGLVARETNPSVPCALTIGQFTAGTAGNIIPETAELRGSARTTDPETQKMLVRRLDEVCRSTAEAFGGTAEVEWTCQVPPLICDPKVVNDMVGFVQELPIPGLTGYNGIHANASEDFALIAAQIPSAYLYLPAGFPDERGQYAAHNPKAQFNEDVLPLGAAVLTHCAVRWLQTHGAEQEEDDA